MAITDVSSAWRETQAPVMLSLNILEQRENVVSWLSSIMNYHGFKEFQRGLLLYPIIMAWCSMIPVGHSGTSGAWAVTGSFFRHILADTRLAHQACDFMLCQLKGRWFTLDFLERSCCDLPYVEINNQHPQPCRMLYWIFSALWTSETPVWLGMERWPSQGRWRREWQVRYWLVVWNIFYFPIYWE